jgi:dihydrodipicolinate synthase/N-acetylneuraminate lyase
MSSPGLTARATPPPPLRPGREILGISAVLLPFHDAGVDWHAFAGLVERTVDAGLVPAVNMDTGYVQLIDAADRRRALELTRSLAGERGFVAGAYVDDEPGDPVDLDAYSAAMQEVAAHGGTPVVFPSNGLTSLAEDDWVGAHAELGRRVERFIAFELGSMFVPWGRIYSLEAYRSLLGVSACIGAKHSSLSRAAEWDRLAVRDEHRPDFHVFTGNDLAIDMVCYGSDYLLGLSALAPDLFAERDARWARGDREFQELNDALQYLGWFAFRPPVPAYRHAAATFLHARGWIPSDATPPGAPRRPASDGRVLRQIADHLGVLP